MLAVLPPISSLKILFSSFTSTAIASNDADAFLGINMTSAKPTRGRLPYRFIIILHCTRICNTKHANALTLQIHLHNNPVSQIRLPKRHIHHISIFIHLQLIRYARSVMKCECIQIICVHVRHALRIGRNERRSTYHAQKLFNVYVLELHIPIFPGCKLNIRIAVKRKPFLKNILSAAECHIV